LTVLLNKAGRLAVLNHTIAKTRLRSFARGSARHRLVVHAVLAGTSSRIDVALDDPATPQIQRTDS
jgi:hypothetical protein